MEKKILSKEDKLQIITQMMTNHNHLCYEIFDADNTPLPIVKDKINELVDFIRHEELRAFPKLEIMDITLNGSLCSYVYTDKSDIDLFIVVGDIFPDNILLTEEILDRVNKELMLMVCKPCFYTHPVDYGVLHHTNKRIKNFNSYSILNEKWKRKPQHQEFLFTPQELYAEYCEYSKKLHDFVNGLEKINDAFLTPKSCNMLNDYLLKLRNSECDAKENSETHEYSLSYNLYRLLKKFGTYSHFQNYINDSYKNNIKRKK